MFDSHCNLIHSQEYLYFKIQLTGSNRLHKLFTNMFEINKQSHLLVEKEALGLLRIKVFSAQNTLIKSNKSYRFEYRFIASIYVLTSENYKYSIFSLNFVNILM